MFKITGTITQVLEAETGEGAKGTWKKQSFIVDTKDEYNPIYCIEVFGEEKVDNFNKYNKINDGVEVEFNIRTNEWKGKYYPALQLWKCTKVEVPGAGSTQEQPQQVEDNGEDVLPF